MRSAEGRHNGESALWVERLRLDAVMVSVKTDR
jgi:hypothetical protein